MTRELAARSTAVVVILRWIALGAIVGALCGCASALFLWLLDRATQTRIDHPWLVYLLPVAGLLMGLFYDRFGGRARAGSALVIETFHEQGEWLPRRMAPLVLVGTVLTHLFGGSAGREGTAVQMGASMSDNVSRLLRANELTRRHLLAAGIAGGFGSVFGTPIAGFVFRLEVLRVGRVDYGAMLPALTASLVGSIVTHQLGIEHTPYPQVAALALNWRVLGLWLVFGVAVALVAIAFMELMHAIKRVLEKVNKRLSVRMAIGGLCVMVMWLIVDTPDYLGLGVPTILRAFGDPTLPEYAFALKLMFTAVTLGAGFVGGEVTPLFFIGATLGSVLARLLGLPMDMGAGVGLAAAFAACSNAPIALSIMAVELLGGALFPHAAIVCVIAYLLSGTRSIYSSQRMHVTKLGQPLPQEASVTTARKHERTARGTADD